MVLATYVIINILMAFVIDVYTSIEETTKQEAVERKAIIDFGRQVNGVIVEKNKTLGKKVWKQLKSTLKTKNPVQSDEKLPLID
jgi:hypothetical protein